MGARPDGDVIGGRIHFAHAMKQTARIGACVLLMAVACSGAKPGSISFPDSIAFAGQTLTKATSWNRGKMSAVVYTPPGQKIPDASMQIGFIISADHTTAASLHNWVIDQGNRAGPPVFSSGEPGAVCRVAWQQLPDGPRTYMSLQVCHTGVARAACAEADETISQSDFNTCVGSSGCQDLCDQRWLERREALDLLVADFIAKR